MRKHQETSTPTCTTVLFAPVLAGLYLVWVVIAHSAISIVKGSETRVIEATNSGVKSILR
jgi:hypothetical protein